MKRKTKKLKKTKGAIKAQQLRERADKLIAQAEKLRQQAAIVEHLGDNADNYRKYVTLSKRAAALKQQLDDAGVDVSQVAR